MRELEHLAVHDDPPHALMLVGPAGLGRTALALHFARLLNCEGGAPAPAGASLFGDEPAPAASKPCGQCRPCRLIEAGNHPDVVHLTPGDTLCRPRPGESHAAHPDSRDIRICQVRGVIETVSRFPIEARYRMVIFEPAERIGRDAAHALLKTLEEPPGHTILVLIASAPEDIIETIRSRCRRLDVRLVPREEIEEGLIARGVDIPVAARASLEARGRPARAIAFAESPGTMDDRTRLVERCAGIAAASMPERLAYAEDLSNRWRRDRAPIYNELDAWEAFWELKLQEAAEDEDDAAARHALRALEALVTVRTDLIAQVQVRPALELMLLTFPRITLAIGPGDREPAHAT